MGMKMGKAKGKIFAIDIRMETTRQKEKTTPW